MPRTEGGASSTDMRGNVNEVLARYERLIEVHPDALLVNRGGTITYANPAALALFGAPSLEDLAGRPVLDLIHPASRPAVSERMDRLQNRGCEHVPLLRERIVRLDGAVRDVECVATTFEEGGERAIQVVMHDITDRLRAEAAERHASAQLARAIDLVRLGIGEIDLITGEVHLFGCAEELLGSRVATVEGFFERLHPADRARVREELVRLESEAGTSVGEWRFLRPDGAVRWVAGSAQVVRDATGTPTRHVAAFYDITDRKKAEGALAESEARARAVLNAAINAIVTIDDRGRIESFNPAAERLFGYEASAMIGRNVSELMPSPERERHDEYLRRYLETGKAAIIGIGREVVGRRKDGTTFPLHLGVNDTLVRGRHMFIGVLRDLTVEREAEARERELQRRALQNERLADIGAVTARIVHDFGNPLAGLTMTAQRILQKIAREPNAPVDSIKAAAERTLETTRRLDVLVQEFKEFARETRLELNPLDVPSLLTQVVRSWETEAASQAIAVECVAPIGMPPVRADEDKLRRVLDNLVKNALEAIGRGPGTVRLEARVDRDRLVLSVEDDGPGVPPGLDVFALFETTKPRGTGLGLPICRQIILAHGGGIEFAPRHPRGTVFRVELPIHGPV